MAAARAPRAASGDLSSIAALMRLITFFTRVRFDLLRKFLISFCLALLMADLWGAKVVYSFPSQLNFINTCLPKACQALFFCISGAAQPDH